MLHLQPKVGLARLGQIAIFGAALSLCSLRVEVRAGAKSHEAAALALLETLHPEALFESAVSQTLSMQVEQNPVLAPLRPVVEKFFRKYMSWSSLQPDFVRIYTEAFSEKELLEIAAFNKTPAGKKAVELMPTLMEKGMRLAMTRAQQHSAELDRELREATAPAPAAKPAAKRKP